MRSFKAAAFAQLPVLSGSRLGSQIDPGVAAQIRANINDSLAYARRHGHTNIEPPEKSIPDSRSRLRLQCTGLFQCLVPARCWQDLMTTELQ